MITTRRLPIVTLSAPYPDWQPLDTVTVGKEYEITYSGNLRPLTQLTIINDNGEEMRILGHHFLPPDAL